MQAALEQQTTRNTRQIVESYHAAWKCGDLESIMALYHEDIRYHDHFLNRTLTYNDLRSYVEKSLPVNIGDSLQLSDGIRVDGDTAFIQYCINVRGASYRSSEAIVVNQDKILEINEYGVLSQSENTKAPAVPNHQAMKRLGLSVKQLSSLSQDFQDYINTQKPYLNDLISLQQVSSECGYSRNQISYLLNNVIGHSFYEFIHNLRIEHFLDQVNRLTEMPDVQKLAFESGFNSMSVFYKHFKRKTGVSPKTYLLSKIPRGHADKKNQ